MSGCNPDDPPFRFNSSTREEIAGRPNATLLRFKGDVSIVCKDLTVFADELTWDADTNRITLLGNIVLQQPDLSIYAERAELDRVTKLGSFFNARGTARLSSEPGARNPFTAEEPDVMFYGDEIAKVGPRRYHLKNGAFSSCTQPTPRWMMTGSNVTVALDQYILMKNMVLRVKDVPLLYLPGMYYPINKEGRSTGFLLPTYGSSTVGGASLSNAFFWAISRSQDATFKHMWNGKTGQVYSTEYRYVTSPGSQGSINFQMEGIKGLTSSGGSSTPSTATKYNIRLNGGAAQSLPHGFYLSANASYFTELLGQQRVQDINVFSRSDRQLAASLSGQVGRLRISANANQTEYFTFVNGVQVPGALNGQRPVVNLSLPDRPIGRSKIYYGVTSESGYLLRNPTPADPTTDQSLWRFDVRPSIRAPLSPLPYLSATATASWRLTRWLESLDPTTGEQIQVALNRQLLETSARIVGPVVARVFQTPNNGYAERFKHVIEPTFSISRTSAFDELNRVVQLDYNDYIVGGTTRIEYRLSNKLLARRRAPGSAPGPTAGPGIVREILTVDLRQTYYSDARAQRSDTSYESGLTADTTNTKGTYGPLTLEAITRPNDVTTGQFRMEIDSRYRKVRSYTAGASLQSTYSDLDIGWNKQGVIPQLPGYDANSQRHYLNLGTTLRTRGDVLGGSYVMRLDIKNTSFTEQRIVARYNSQCCGVSFDWQSISTPYYSSLGIPSDNRFGISFTLAGIGSFANPMSSLGGGR